LVKILFPNLAPNLIKSNFENTKHFILNQFTKKKKKKNPKLLSNSFNDIYLPLPTPMKALCHQHAHSSFSELASRALSITLSNRQSHRPKTRTKKARERLEKAKALQQAKPNQKS
jgi:hypothetical protein